MYIGISTQLKKLGRFRIGIGKKVSGKNAVFFLFFAAVFYLVDYIVLASLWLMYGICWVFFYLPIRAIINLVRKKKQAQCAEQK